MTEWARSTSPGLPRLGGVRPASGTSARKGWKKYGFQDLEKVSRAQALLTERLEWLMPAAAGISHSRRSVSRAWARETFSRSWKPYFFQPLRAEVPDAGRTPPSLGNPGDVLRAHSVIRSGLVLELQ